MAGVLGASLALAGCALPGRLPALTVDQSRQTDVLDIPNARFMATETEQLTAEFVAAAQREVAARRQSGETGPLPPVAYLAISGGGDDGAYGAGVLVGWTAHGGRPNFKAVTGISTGALSAPYAFLGPEYDPQLKAVYTETSAQRIFKPRSKLAAIFSDAMGDTGPLQEYVRSSIDDRMVERIAEEYRKGRLLLILTTNLDAGQACVWNLGAIAASGQPGARELIIKILLASAAIPAAFPPVMFDLEIDGQPRQEMHVDGGVIAQAFLYPPSIDAAETARAGGMAGRQRDAYVIRNGRLQAEATDVKRRTIDIAGRSVSVMISTAGLNDMYRIYATTTRDGIGYHVAYIGNEFTDPYKGPFDRVYMTTLFQFGYEQGLSGAAWKSRPPFLEE